MIYQVLEHPWVYALNQKLNPWTVGSYRRFVETKVRQASNARVLDVGCGLGDYRPLLGPCVYTGIDLNPRYIESASRRYGEGFQVMDASRLSFPSDSFDVAFSVATCHHLSDAEIRAMITEIGRALSPSGHIHIIDPILPIDTSQSFKTWVFQSDRGRFQRTKQQMVDLMSSCGSLVEQDIDSGPVHDVLYVKLAV
jgi:SAM-dependent methyltransferase